MNILLRILKFFAKGLLSFLVIMLLYFSAAVIGSVIPVNSEQSEVGNITIYLRTNGVHTDYIFPIKNRVNDWGEFLDLDDIRSEEENFNYVSFGWGDLDFYQNTPQWRDLRFPTAMQAVFLPTPSAMHVEFLATIRMNHPTVPVSITDQQYQLLVNYVGDSFEKDARGELKQVANLHYNQNDAFYHATRSLNFFYTCNTWVNNGLKEAGLRACLWTPFDTGIFYQYR